MTETELVLKKIAKLGFETRQVLDLIEINGGLYKPEIALLIAKGLKYDGLQTKFEFLERAYYQLEEENMKAQLHAIDLESRC